MRDVYTILRPRFDQDLSGVGRRPIGESHGQYPAFVGRVIANPALATTTGRYYAVHIVSVLGVESEGGPGILVEDTSTIVYVYVLGSYAPVVGDDLVCRFIENRWVAERFGHKSSGTGTGTIPGCACFQIPASLHMSSSGPCGDKTFPACDIVYGPTPPEISNLDLGANCYLSTQLFNDTGTGASYRFNLSCNTIFFRLSRVYYPSANTNAFHDATIYSWSIGQPGNTCTPFLLSVGYIYAGGNPNCLVVISE